MDQRDRLAVAAEQAAGIDVDQLQYLGIELDLQRNGEDIVRVSSTMDAVKVLPTVCVEFGGSTASVTGWRRWRRALREWRGSQPAACRIAAASAASPAGSSAAPWRRRHWRPVVAEWPVRGRSDLREEFVERRVGAAQFESSSGAGIDGAGVQRGSARIRGRCAGSG